MGKKFWIYYDQSIHMAGQTCVYARDADEAIEVFLRENPHIDRRSIKRWKED